MYSPENYSHVVVTENGLKYDLYAYETAEAIFDVEIRQFDGRRIYLINEIVSSQTKVHKVVETHFDIKPKENTNHDPNTKTKTVMC